MSAAHTAASSWILFPAEYLLVRVHRVSACADKSSLSELFPSFNKKYTKFPYVPHPFLSKTGLRLLYIKPYSVTEKPAYVEFELKKNRFLSENFSKPDILWYLY
jgi:hypothetical protein